MFGGGQLRFGGPLIGGMAILIDGGGALPILGVRPSIMLVGSP